MFDREFANWVFDSNFTESLEKVAKSPSKFLSEKFLIWDSFEMMPSFSDLLRIPTEEDYLPESGSSIRRIAQLFFAFGSQTQRSQTNLLEAQLRPKCGLWKNVRTPAKSDYCFIQMKQFTVHMYSHTKSAHWTPCALHTPPVITM